MKKIRIVLLFCICMMLCGCGKKMDADAVEKKIHGIVNGTEKYKVKEKGTEGGIEWFLTKDGMMVVSGDATNVGFWEAPWDENDEVVGLYFDVENIKSTSHLANKSNNLLYIDVSNLNTENAENLSDVFTNCEKLERIDGLENWDVSKVEKMDLVFFNLPSLKSVKGIENWDVSNVNTFDYVFEGCNSLESIDVKDWDVQNVTDFSALFKGCSSLKEIDVSNWKISSAENMTGMFGNCPELTEIKGIENWEPKDGVFLMAMFNDCLSIKEINLSNWKISDNAFIKMFHNCTSLEKLDMRNIILVDVREHRLDGIFEGCENLKEVYLHSSFKEYLESDDYEGYVPDCITYVE